MNNDLTFDYIVVGGGTAGPVVARRLADGDPSSTVCLLEAGPTHENAVNSHMAFAWKSLHETEYDWNYISTPQVNLDNRVLTLPRGKLLGGSNAINGTLVIRGTKHDYDRIAAMGNPGWSWNDLLPYFKASETFHPNSWHQADLSVHGNTGPLHTEPYKHSTISEKVLESFIDKGFTYKPDMFVQGESEGVGHAVRVVHNGRRTTAADFVFPTRPANLHLRVNTYVQKVILTTSADGYVVASGVLVHDLAKNLVFEIKARKEVIISAGTYNSPVVLMRSGIGPLEHLREVGVECMVDLPGVGQNLTDHYMVTQAYSVPQGLTIDHLVYPEGALENEIKLWGDTGESIMSHVPFGPIALARVDKFVDDPRWTHLDGTDEDLIGQFKDQPHVEFFSTDYYGTLPQKEHFPKEGESAFIISTMLCGTKSRGYIKLRSNKSEDNPFIDYNIFASDVDLAVLAAGCRLAHEIITQGEGTKNIVKPWPKDRTYPRSPAEWIEFAKKRVGITYHPGGTVKMAPKEDPMGCVNARLQVYGIANLRVADCSILPYLPNGHTMAAALVIGEKAAAMILEEQLTK